MVKKKNQDLDDFDFDNDLDSGFDDFDFGDEIDEDPTKSKKGKRSAIADVFSGTISGAVSKFKDPEFLGESVRKSLPKSYDGFMEEASSAASTLTQTYDDAVKDIKPQLGNIASNVNRIIPENLSAVKKLTDKIDVYFNGEKRRPDVRESAENMAISGVMTEVFGRQKDLDDQERAEDKAEDRVKSVIDDKRFKTSTDILRRISDSTGKVASIKEGVELSFYKKSLEFQVRQLFTMQNLTDSTIKYQEISSKQTEAIVKNTALPEFVKLRESERFKEIARNKFYDSVQGTIMEGTGLGKMAKRASTDAKDYIGGIKNGLMGASDISEMIREQIDGLDELSASGDFDISRARMGGEMLGAGAADKIRSFITDIIKEVAESDEDIGKTGHFLTMASKNSGGFAKRFGKSSKFEEYQYADGAKGQIGKILEYLISISGDAGPDMNLKEAANVGDLDKPGVVTNKFIRSVEEVIPSWLAHIHRELVHTRNPDKPAPTLSRFDFSKGEIISKEKAKSDAFDTLRKNAESYGFNYNIDKTYESIMGDAETPEMQQKEIRAFIMKLSREKNVWYDQEGITGSKSFNDLSPDAQEAVRKATESISADKDTLESNSRMNDITNNFLNTRKSTADFRGVIEGLLKNNTLDVLLEDGIVEYDESGGLRINEKRYYEFADQRYGVSDKNRKTKIKPVGAKRRTSSRYAKSDVEAKEGIDETSGGFLDAIKKTKIYSWFYKKGEGDQKEHIGPMAQDVNSNMGEETAPGGKKIDLVNLNGINMAATQELSDRVDALEGTDAITASYLRNIDLNIANMLKVLQDKSFLGFGIPEDFKNSISEAISKGFEYAKGKSALQKGLKYAKTVGRTGAKVAKAVGLGGVVTGKGLFKAARGTAEWMNDVLLKPGLDFLNDKETKESITKAIGTTFKNTLKFGNMLFGQVSKTITERIPKVVTYIKEKASAFLGTLYEGVLGQVDMYIKGQAEPAIRAARLRAGEYYDSATGQVLKTLKDIESSKGDIINKAGEVVVSTADLAEGLVDRFGKSIKRKALNALQVGMHIGGAVAKGVGRLALKAGKKVGDFLGITDGRFDELRQSLKEGIGDAFGDLNLGMGISKEADTAIIDIRDLLYRVYPDAAEDVEKNKAAAGSDKAKRGKGLLKSLKDFIKSDKEDGKDSESITDKIKSGFESLQNSATSTLDEARAKYRSSGDGSSGPGLISRGAKYLKERFGKPKPAGENGGGEGGAGGAGEGGGGEGTPPAEGPGLFDRARDLIGGLGGGRVGRSATRARRRAAVRTGRLLNRIPGGRLIRAGGGAISGLISSAGGIGGMLGKAGDAIKGMFGNEAADLVDTDKDSQDARELGDRREKVYVSNKGPSFNDTDGDGVRSGGWQDRFEDMESEKRERLKRKKLDRSEAKYKSGQNVIDKLMASAEDIYGGITSLAGGLLDTGLSIFGGAKTLANTGVGRSAIGRLSSAALTAKNSIASKLALLRGARPPVPPTPPVPPVPPVPPRGGSGAGRLLSRGFTKAVPIIGTGIAVAGGLSDIYDSETSDKSRTEKNVDTSKAIGSTAGAIGGGFAGAKAGAAIGMLGGPIGMALGALVGGVAGAYLGDKVGGAAGAGGAHLLNGAAGAVSSVYKYATRKTANEVEMIRMFQYGVGHTDDSKAEIHKIFRLEDYLEDGRIGYNGSNAYINDKKIKPTELIEIFNIDKKDVAAVTKFGIWYNERFKPFFCKHLTIMMEIDNKFKLKDISSLKGDDLKKYLDKATFESGPYALDESPFKAVPSLLTDKKYAVNQIAKVRAGKEDPKGKEIKPPPSLPVKPVDKVEKIDAETKVSEEDKKLIEKSKAERSKNALGSAAAGAGLVGASEGLFESEDGGDKSFGAGKEKGSTSVSYSAGTMEQAVGDVKDGSGAHQFMTMNDKGVNIDSMNPAMKKQFLGMIEEYGELTGKKVIITSGTRTSAQQAALRKKYPNKAAKPGRSLHEFGLAVDVNTPDVNALDKLGLMRKYGFTRPVGGETWHVEPIGIQSNIGNAKKDSSLASEMIASGLGAGGGGLGARKGTPLGIRDPNVSKLIRTASNKIVKPEDSTGSPGVPAVATSSLPSGSSNSTGSDAVAGNMDKAPAAKQAQGYMDVGYKGNTNASLLASNSSGSVGSTPSGGVMTPSQGAVDNVPDVESKPSIAASAGTKDTSAKGSLKAIIEEGARKAGMDGDMMKAFAAVESSMNPSAAASTSSARGLYQFLKATWREQVDKHAKKYGLDRGVSPNDPYASTLIASEYMKTNLKYVSSVKKDTNIVDAYLTHFLGPGGAKTFLSAPKDAIAAQVMPKAANANKGIFFEKGRPRTIGEVYAHLGKKIMEKARAFGINVSVGSSSSLGKTDSQQNVDKVTSSTGKLTPTSYTGTGDSSTAASGGDSKGSIPAPSGSSINTSGALPVSSSGVTSAPTEASGSGIGFGRFDPRGTSSPIDSSSDPVRALVASQGHLSNLVDINQQQLDVLREMAIFLKTGFPKLAAGGATADPEATKKSEGEKANTETPTISSIKRNNGVGNMPSPEVNMGRRPFKMT